MVQASATVAAEQPCAAAMRARIGSRSKLVPGPPNGGIGHHRHAMLFTPWQQIMFDVAVTEVVRDLISGTTITLWNMEQLFQVTDIEVGHAPRAYLPSHA